MSRSINPKLLKVLVALKNIGKPMRTQELQKATGLPIAVINKFLYLCNSGMLLQMVEKIGSNSYKFPQSDAVFDEYNVLLDKHGLTEEKELASLKVKIVKAGAVVSDKGDESNTSTSDPVKQSSKQKLVSKPKTKTVTDSSKTKAKTKVAIKRKPPKETGDKNNLESTVVKGGGFEVSRDNVIKALNTKINNAKVRTIKGILDVLKADSAKEAVVLAVLESLENEGLVSQKKTMNSLMWRPSSKSDVFKNAGPLLESDARVQKVLSDNKGETAAEISEPVTSFSEESCRLSSVETGELNSLNEIEEKILSVFTDHGSPSKGLTNKDVINLLTEFSSVKVTRTLNTLASKEYLSKDLSVSPSVFTLVKPVQAAQNTLSTIEDSKKASDSVPVKSKKKTDKVVDIPNKLKSKTMKEADDKPDLTKSGKNLPELLRRAADYIELLEKENEELKAIAKKEAIN